MSLTVRLQGVPPNADSIHIRNFFRGLKIPPSGVKIIGGEKGEAFVKFKKHHCVSLALKRSGKPLMDFPVYVSVENKAALQQNQSTTESNPGYLRIAYRPLDAELCHVKRFFKEFSVESVIFQTIGNIRNGQALVKFGQVDDVHKILTTFQWPQNKNSSKGHKKQSAFSVLLVKKSRQKEWVSWGGIITPCPPKKKKEKKEKGSKCNELYAHLVNVSLRAEKSHISKFFYKLVGDSQITFLCDKNGRRLRECFVMFITENDYVRALELDKAVLKGRRLRVLPISKANMMDLIESYKEVVFEDTISEEEGMEPELKYLYLRNFAACVSKFDVLNFFTGFSLTEKDICLLYDDHGNSLGEALVRFSTKEEASRAEKLNLKRFQDTEILLRRISVEQLKVFNVDCFLDHSTAKQTFSTNRELCGVDICVSEADDEIY